LQELPMPRHLVVLLLLGAVGCSGGPTNSGPSADTHGKPGTPRGSAGRADPPSAKASPRDTQSAGASSRRTPEQLQALIADLRDPDDVKRVRAAKELRQWGKEAESAAGPLATVIATSGAEPREAALEALEAIYPDLASDLHALVADADAAKRIAAAKHLAGLASEAGKPHPTAPLAPVIAWRVAWLPAEARKPNVGYAQAGEEYAALVPLLLKAGLRGDGVKAIAACANVPEGGKPLWEPAQLTLCQLAGRENEFQKAALDALNSSLSSRPSVATLRAAGDLGAAAKGLVPLLQTLAADPDENIRKAAAEALKKIQG
jgi:hypothetical protein